MSVRNKGPIAAAAALILVCCVSQSPRAQEKDPWAPFRFLLGDWAGVGSGKPGEASTGSTTFSLDLDGKVLVRNNRAEYAPKPGEKIGAVHKDLLIIYRQPGSGEFRAIYFDNEGHVIDYSVTLPAEQSSVVFDSAALEKGPRFRLVYRLNKEGALSVEFLVGPPGGEPKSYVTGLLKKKT
jgi:hypothetical protein